MGRQWTAGVLALMIASAGVSTFGSADAADGECDGLADLGVINNAPRALDDQAWSLPGGAVTIDPMANDTDFDGHELMLQSVGRPTSGTAEIGDEGTIEYQPGLGFEGEDTFVYTVTDGRCGSSSPSALRGWAPWPGGAPPSC